MVDLGELLGADLEPALRLEHAKALATIAGAMLEGFPGNLFWDLDFLAAQLGQEARRRGAAGVRQLGSSVAELQRRFGASSVIQFQYTHDFIYGFDWARWVSKDPEHRAGVGPFDLEFVRYLERRGTELELLVQADDEKYPKLAPGEARNPFAFSRTPVDERRLHVDLAQRGLLPVEAWRTDAQPRWHEPYAELRNQLARELGL